MDPYPSRACCHWVNNPAWLRPLTSRYQGQPMQTLPPRVRQGQNDNKWPAASKHIRGDAELLGPRHRFPARRPRTLHPPQPRTPPAAHGQESKRNDDGAIRESGMAASPTQHNRLGHRAPQHENTNALPATGATGVTGATGCCDHQNNNNSAWNARCPPIPPNHRTITQPTLASIRFDSIRSSHRRLIRTIHYPRVVAARTTYNLLVAVYCTVRLRDLYHFSTLIMRPT